jgi:hypothetical protein
MSLRYEYRTTHADWHLPVNLKKAMVGQEVATLKGAASYPDPVPPPGDGWDLVCATASGATLFWFWRRLKA